MEEDQKANVGPWNDPVLGVAFRDRAHPVFRDRGLPIADQNAQHCHYDVTNISFVYISGTKHDKPNLISPLERAS